MPRWLTTLFILLLFFGFVLPNPAAAGAATGNAIESVVVFFQSATGQVANSTGTGPYDGGDVRVYPRGGVGSGDGTTDDGDTHLLGLASAPVATPVPPPAPRAGMSHSPPVKLNIPSIGVTSGFVALGLDSTGAMEVPQAADVVGWYRYAPTPGERGPAVLTAHVDWLNTSGVFRDLGQLKPGDDVTVDRADGVAVTFRVVRVAAYPKVQFPTEEVYGSTEEPELRLITCGGRFDPTTRSYENNIVVYARNVAVG